jgi:two-component system response regulator NreC
VSTRVLVADGIGSTVRSALETADGIELEADPRQTDVVLLDHSALASIPELLRQSPQAKVVVLATRDDPDEVRQAFAAGASGYVLEPTADDEIVAAVREVADGGRYVNPGLGARLVAAESDAQRRAEHDPLSEREREVLRLLVLGHTNQEIAAQLVISVRTAETHRAHIMGKLGLSSRAELVRYALDRGLLQNTAQ